MPFAKRPRYSKKSLRKSKVPRTLALSISNQLVHRHVATCSSSTNASLTVFNPSSGVAVFQYGTFNSSNMALAFQLSGTAMYLGGTLAAVWALPNLSELQALYDSYVIEKVEVSIWDSATVAQIGNVNQNTTFPDPIGYATQPMPLIGWTVDLDDFANTSFTDLQQYSTFKCKQLGGGYPIKQTVYPCAREDLNSGSGQGRAAQHVINCSTPGVNHYGLKMSIDGFKATNPSAVSLSSFLSIQTKYHLKMIATR